MESNEQRHDSGEPFGRVQKKAELEKVDDERLVRETERLFDYLDEEDSKQNANAGESSGDGKASASFSGPATSEGEVP